MNILIEAAGSLTSAYLIKAIHDAGYKAVATDISKQNASSYLADDFIKFPPVRDINLWDKVEKLIISHKIDIVIPSFDEMMFGWAKIANKLKRKNINVIISPQKTVSVFQNKWNTYKFFKENNIPTPATSLKKDFDLVKPIYGRGAKGIQITKENIEMNGYISQEIIKGQEYTIDALFDIKGSPIYIIPRKRINILDGKSIKGEVDLNSKVIQYIIKISKKIKFKGPINFQCFVNKQGIFFTEVNPRLGGGTALAFAASENWIPLLVDNFLFRKGIKAKQVKDHLKMFRYYAEYFVS